MNLAPLSGSDKAWTWTAMDHSDPESQPRQEFFAVRFKQAETAAEFGTCFNNAKKSTKQKGPLLKFEHVLMYSYHHPEDTEYLK